MNYNYHHLYIKLAWSTSDAILLAKVVSAHAYTRACMHAYDHKSIMFVPKINKTAMWAKSCIETNSKLTRSAARACVYVTHGPHLGGMGPFS